MFLKPRVCKCDKRFKTLRGWSLKPSAEYLFRIICVFQYSQPRKIDQSINKVIVEVHHDSGDSTPTVNHNIPDLNLSRKLSCLSLQVLSYFCNLYPEKAKIPICPSMRLPQNTTVLHAEVQTKRTSLGPYRWGLQCASSYNRCHVRALQCGRKYTFENVH